MLLTEPEAALRWFVNQIPEHTVSKSPARRIPGIIKGKIPPRIVFWPRDSLYYRLDSIHPWKVCRVRRTTSDLEGRWGGGICLDDNFLEWLDKTMSAAAGPYPSVNGNRLLADMSETCSSGNLGSQSRSTMIRMPLASTWISPRHGYHVALVGRRGLRLRRSWHVLTKPL